MHREFHPDDIHHLRATPSATTGTTTTTTITTTTTTARSTP